jgi:multicomponent Na+:H+ antiporter subunit F
MPMSTVDWTLLCLAVVLLTSLVAGLARVLAGPTRSDRMLAAQLMGTTGVGVLLLLSYALRQPALVDVALVFALLTALAAIAFVQSIGSRTEGGR